MLNHKHFARLTVAVVALSVLFKTASAAELKLPAVFGDHMVLQQEMPIPVWGTDTPNREVTVTFAGQKSSVRTDANGKWLVKLPLVKATNTPEELRVSGSSEIVLHDVLVGEVWFASGQSNMWFTLSFALNAPQEIKAATYPNLRLFTAGKSAADQPQSDIAGQWDACTPATAKDFSAVGYFFGRDLHRALNVPVGIINSSWPGSYIESWISAPTLTKDADNGVIQDRWSRAVADMPALLEAYRTAHANWVTTSATARAEGKKPAVEPRNPLGSDSIPDAAHAGFVEDPAVGHYMTPHPSALYNGMVAPFIPFAIRGVLWYQGESNFIRPVQYARLLPEMIGDWRANWGEGDFPFLYVQLPYIGGRLKPEDAPQDAYYQFPLIREAQRKAQSVPRTCMIVTTDNTVDTDIHPRNKQIFGARLANAALSTVYGRDVPYRGPDFISSQVESNTVRIKFDSHGGLVCKGGEVLKGFSIAGPDHHYVWADAKIEGETVVVSSPQIPKPVSVRYGWNNSADWNLFNAAGLPASPFQTDDYAPEPAKGR